MGHIVSSKILLFPEEFLMKSALERNTSESWGLMILIPLLLLFFQPFKILDI